MVTRYAEIISAYEQTSLSQLFLKLHCYCLLRFLLDHYLQMKSNLDQRGTATPTKVEQTKIKAMHIILL
jgi:hypothetical protein